MPRARITAASAELLFSVSRFLVELPDAASAAAGADRRQGSWSQHPLGRGASSWKRFVSNWMYFSTRP